MPGLEDIPKSSTPPENSMDSPDQSELEPQQQQAVRELTQTDRINRHLLKSFLERINTAGFDQNFRNAGNGSDGTSDGFDE